MEFLLSAAIFLVSTGFLVGTSVAPSPPAAIASGPASGAGESGAPREPRAEAPGMSSPTAAGS